MFINIEKRNPSNSNLQQALNIGIRERAKQLLGKWLEPVKNSGDYRFIRFCLLNPFVNPFFYEDSFECAEMEFVLELAFLDLELPLQKLDQFFGVLPKNFSNG